MIRTICERVAPRLKGVQVETAGRTLMDHLHLIRWGRLTVQLNRIYSHEEPEIFHTHGWMGFSIILAGRYEEQFLNPHMTRVTAEKKAGQVNLFPPYKMHRISGVEAETWTLHVTWGLDQNWGTFQKADRGWLFMSRGIGASVPYRTRAIGAHPGAQT